MLLYARDFAIVPAKPYAPVPAVWSHWETGGQNQVPAVRGEFGPDCRAALEVSIEDRTTLMTWRGRRKRLAATCLFLVLTALIMGVRLTWGYAPWLTAVFMVAAALFAWRVYRTPIRLGWF